METYADLRDSSPRIRLPAGGLAPATARRFLRVVLTEWAAPPVPGGPAAGDGAIDDAVLLVSELVTAAAPPHARGGTGSEVEIACRLLPPPPGSAGPPYGGGSRQARVAVDVATHHLPGSRPDAVLDAPEPEPDGGSRDYRALLLGALAESWGVTYRHGERTVWCHLAAPLAVRAGDDGSGTARDGAAVPDVLASPPAAPDAAPGPAVVPDAAPGPALVPDAAADAPDVREAPGATGAAGRGAGPAGDPGRSPERTGQGADPAGESFLAEVGELLAGQLDEDMVTALTGQLLVPRLADWCGVWLTTTGGDMRLARVWHRDERRIRALRSALENDRPPPVTLSPAGVPWPWPEGADDTGHGGSALLFPLVLGGRCHGALLIGRAGAAGMTGAVARLAEDVARRVAQAVTTARHYTRQADISHSLQRRQLPTSLAAIPGIDAAIIYEPCGEGQTVGGDFYDLFPRDDRRWCFLLGDVCGHDLDAMSVTGLARHLVRLLAREGHGVESLLARLNLAMAEEGAEAQRVGGEQAGSRFLSLLYGELEPDAVAGGARCTVASAGHPLPLLLTADGTVVPAAEPQMLLGIDEHAEFGAHSFRLAPGETLLCVTDGVTERRNGTRQLDDDDGLAEVLRGCAGLGAKAVAERVRRAAHDFGPGPIDDDLAILVLETVPVPGAALARGPV